MEKSTLSKKSISSALFFSCPKTSNSECLDIVERDYFFYFSLENSLCNDYVTETLFNAMEYYVIPVVYGRVNYEDFLPPHSFIDVNQFNRTTDLANYLIQLSSDPAEYSKYFWWKKFYPKININRNYRNLCRAIHELSSSEILPEDVTFYSNIESWWKDNQCLESPSIQLI